MLQAVKVSEFLRMIIRMVASQAVKNQSKMQSKYFAFQTIDYKFCPELFFGNKINVKINKNTIS